ncbi:unnamed protein product [Linum tenue]|uniref:Uncharacterized protein n=1 Tax=Linum tenue TaxID=586396 RepID=A0AAV0HZ21_9ROSI|nr:unnamed protein product [Linum tenue]
MGRRSSSSSSFRRSGILLICAILAAHLAISTSKAIDFLPALNSPVAGCNGSIAECMAAGSVGDDNGDGEEFAMESESAYIATTTIGGAPSIYIATTTIGGAPSI